MSVNPTELWQFVQLEDLLTHTLGGDWGKDPDHEDIEYEHAYCIRASEIPLWTSNKGSTAALRKIKKASIEKRALAVGDILVEISGGGPTQPVGRTVLIDETALSINPQVQKICTNFFRQIRPSSFIFAKYLELFLKSIYFSPQINELQSGSNNLRNLKFNDYLKLAVPVPPLTQQKKIIQKIEELFSEIDDGIQSLETAKKQLETYREATLIQAFEGKLTEEWRRDHQNLVSTTEILKSKFSDEREFRYENEIEKWKASVKEWESKQLEGRKPTKPRAPKDVQKLANDTLATLPTLPSEWYWDTLRNITSGVEYGTSSKSQESGSVPVIRMGNIQQGVIDWDDLVYTSDEQEIKQYELKAGDVLFNRTNSPELVGKTAIYKGEQPAIFAGYLIRVNHYSNLIDSNFLNYYLNSHIAKTYGNSVKTDGVNQSNINGEKLQNYPFPFCSLEEQLEIVKIISNFLDKEKVTRQYLDSELKRAHLLKQSILQKAFSGELVPQDPNDEPASVLLERIKAEKEEELTKAKANKIPKKSTKRKTKTIKEDEPAQQELI